MTAVHNVDSAGICNCEQVLRVHWIKEGIQAQVQLQICIKLGVKKATKLCTEEQRQQQHRRDAVRCCWFCFICPGSIMKH
jgi:hypothetical protein